MAAAATQPGVLDLLKNLFSLTPGLKDRSSRQATSLYEESGAPGGAVRHGRHQHPQRAPQQLFVAARVRHRPLSTTMMITGPGEGRGHGNAIAAADKSLASDKGL